MEMIILRKGIVRIVICVLILILSIDIYIYHFYPFSTYLFIQGIKQKYIIGQQNTNDDIVIILAEQQYNRKHDITVLPVLCSYLIINKDYTNAAKYLDIASMYNFGEQNKGISLSRVEVYMRMNNYDDFVRVYNEEKTKTDYNRKKMIDSWIYNILLKEKSSLNMSNEDIVKYCTFMLENIDKDDETYTERCDYYNSCLN